MSGPVTVTQGPKPAADPAQISVSVVIPAYQVEEWIRDAVASVAVQHLDNATIEVIVVDDGSTDQTASAAQCALDEFELTGIVIRQQNAGVSNARNTGWRAARGRWIQFLDADDELAEGKLTTQLGVGLAAGSGCGVVYSAWQHLVLDGLSWVPSGPLEDPSFDEPVRGIVEDHWFGYVGPCLIQMAALIALNGFDETRSLGEDLDLMLRLAIAGWGFRRAATRVPLFFYRLASGSLWQRASTSPAALRGKNATETNAETYLRTVQGNKLSARTRLAFAKRYMATYQFARNVDKSLAEDLLRQMTVLRLLRAPENAPRSVRVLAPMIGLGAALRVHSRARTIIPAIP